MFVWIKSSSFIWTAQHVWPQFRPDQPNRPRRSGWNLQSSKCGSWTSHLEKKLLSASLLSALCVIIYFDILTTCSVAQQGHSQKTSSTVTSLLASWIWTDHTLTPYKEHPTWRHRTAQVCIHNKTQRLRGTCPIKIRRASRTILVWTDKWPEMGAESVGLYKKSNAIGRQRIWHHAR